MNSFISAKKCTWLVELPSGCRDYDFFHDMGILVFKKKKTAFFDGMGILVFKKKNSIFFLHGNGVFSEALRLAKEVKILFHRLGFGPPSPASHLECIKPLVNPWDKRNYQLICRISSRVYVKLLYLTRFRFTQMEEPWRIFAENWNCQKEEGFEMDLWDFVTTVSKFDEES